MNIICYRVSTRIEVLIRRGRIQSNFPCRDMYDSDVSIFSSFVCMILKTKMVGSHIFIGIRMHLKIVVSHLVVAPSLIYSKDALKT